MSRPQCVAIEVHTYTINAAISRELIVVPVGVGGGKAKKFAITTPAQSMLKGVYMCQWYSIVHSAVSKLGGGRRAHSFTVELVPRQLHQSIVRD